MKVKITIYCTNTGLTRWNCYIYGIIRFNIGNRQENQDIEIYNVERDHNIRTAGKSEVVIKEKDHLFQEFFDFTTSDDQIVFTGVVKDSTIFGKDPTIGHITGKSNAVVKAEEVYNVLKTERFSSGSQYVKITITFTKA